MFKKLNSLFFFLCIFSLQAIELPNFTNVDNMVQESYNQMIKRLSDLSFLNKFIPKKPITHELTQIHFVTFLNTILKYIVCARGGGGAIVFYNNIHQIEPLKKYFDNVKNTYLIAADINKIEQEIKDIFNITTKPTIIYYHKGEEIARSTNFNIHSVVQNIKNTTPFKTSDPFYHIHESRFLDLKNLLQEFDLVTYFFAKKYSMFKFIPKMPIANELIHFYFSSLLERIFDCSMSGVTVVAFYNNIQTLESLKNLIEQQNNPTYLMIADINKIKQEIKNIFNITTKPTIIYYYKGKEITRSIKFIAKDVEKLITTILKQ